MSCRNALLLLLIAAVCPATARERFVSLIGTSENAGTLNKPWDLQTALSTASPGDTVWIRGGLYRGNFSCAASGTKNQPIIFHAYPEERVRIDGGSTQHPALTVQCSYAWFWGLEIFSSDTRRTSFQSGSNPTDIGRGIGIAIEQTPYPLAGLKFINLILHDNFESLGLWAEAVDAEVYGNIIYFDGWDAPDRGHGHGIYTQNADTGTKRIEDNILFEAFSHGLHAYAQSDLVQDYYIEGNVAFNNGRLASDTESTNFRVGGGSPPRNIVFKNNYAYFSPDADGGDSVLGSDTGCSNLLITGNHFIAQRGRALVKPNGCTAVTMTGNVFFGAISGFSAAAFPNNTFLAAPPKAVEAFVRPNRYEPGRANIVVYNWPRGSTVQVDVSGVLRPGDDFEVRDAQNPVGAPILTGTYEGVPLTLPMELTAVASPVGHVPRSPVHTDAAFGVFLLRAPKRISQPAAVTAPSVAPSGIRNAASFALNAIAPGSLISIFGSNLAEYPDHSDAQPLESSLGGATVKINGTTVPLLYADPEQINAQVPYTIPPGAASAVVTVGDVESTPAEFPIQPAAPGIFQVDGTRAAVLNPDWSLNSPAHPAVPGDAVAAYCTGLGVPDPAPPAGTSSPGPLQVEPAATATLGAAGAPVLYSGLAPGFVGLFQVNLTVPQLPPGDYELEIAVGNARSNRALVAVGSRTPAPASTETLSSGIR